MTLNEIKTTMKEGRKVYWKTSAYQVINNGAQWLICCSFNDSCIGLTWTDGVTMNGKPEDFYIEESEE